MKKNTIRLIIAFASFSLLGLIATQLFWVNNAFILAETQYDNRVTIALQNALDEYVQRKEVAACNSANGCLAATNTMDSLFINLVPEEMDSILKVHFEYHGLDTTFNLAVINCLNGEVLFSKNELHSRKEKISTHKISLSCLHHSESHHLEIGFGTKQKLVMQDVILWLIASVVFLLVVILVFSFTVFSIIRQKKMSDIRTDFINNMTHEFKTPIANISLASEVLKRNETKNSPERIDRYAGIIYDENQRMRSQVERVLQVAIRNRDDLTIDRQFCDIHQLITEAVDNMCFPECETGTKISINFRAETSELNVDPMHFSNIIHNLLDNAKKYSSNTPEINISTSIKQDKFVIEIADNGIGISSQAQKHIFEKFYSKITKVNNNFFIKFKFFSTS
jgi:two-component system phosphate regulon sensor histidine kinase PhoR